MTDYNKPTDAELGVEKPILSSVMIKLRNMVLAMFEKAPGAPVLADEYIVSAMMAPNSVGVGVVGNDAIPESSIKWDSAGGISQSLLFSDEFSTSSATEVVLELYIYIPSNASSIEFSWWQRSSDGGTSQARLSVPSQDSSNFNFSTSTYVYTTIGTLDISAEGGWTKIAVELFTSSNTVYVKQGTYRFI